jgi:transcriptional regulator with XRE-family HTH domain
LIRERLVELREKKKLSRGALSAATVRTAEDGERSWVPEATIQAIEKRVGYLPNAETIEMLADALGVPPEDLAEHEYPIAAARREAASTPEAARQREADALRKRAARAQQQSAHPEDDPDTSDARPRRRGRAS